MAFPPPNGSFQGQYGSGFQFYSNGNGAVFYQGYQPQGQINPPDPYHDIFSHPNQNPNLYQQHQFSVRPPTQQQNYYQQNYQSPPPPPPNPSQYFPPMGQIPIQQTQQQAYPTSQHQSVQMPPPQKRFQNNSNDAIKIPPELNCPADPLDLDSSSLSSLYKPYRSPFSISVNDTSTESQNTPKSNSAFAYIPPPFSFDTKSDNCCSFLKTGRQPTIGNYYMCYTCQQKISHNNQLPVIVCENCSKKCHNGHKLQKINPNKTAFCNCGAGDIERCIGLNNDSNCKCKIVPFSITSCIMYNNNNTKNQNPLFYCETCSKRFGSNCIICNSCASICHSGHKLDPAGFGNECKCFECKTCKLFGQAQ